MPRSVRAVQRSNRRASHLTSHHSGPRLIGFLLLGAGGTGGAVAQGRETGPRLDDAQTNAIFAYVKGRADETISAGRPERAGGS